MSAPNVSTPPPHPQQQQQQLQQQQQQPSSLPPPPLQSPVASQQQQQRSLVLVVEGTAAMGPMWSSLRTDYVDKIVRAFSGKDSNAQNGEMALVVFHSHGPYSSCLIQRSGWTNNVEVFMNWLSSLSFVGGGFGEVAVAEGIAEALMMFTSQQQSTSNEQQLHRHCVLIAASNPHCLPTPVPHPPQLINGDDSPNKGRWLADAASVAKAYSQFSVTLSVICPRQLPALKSLYDAALKQVDGGESFKHPHHLVLVSEGFTEAKSSLQRSNSSSGLTTATTVPVVKTEQPASTPPLSVPPSSSTVPRTVARQTMPTLATVKTESSSVPPYPNVVVPAVVSTAAIHSSTSSAISDGQDFKSVISSSSNPLQSLRPVGGAASILNSVSHSHMRQVLSAAGSLSSNSLGSTPGQQTSMGMSQVMSGISTVSSGIAALPVVGQTGTGSLTQQVVSSNLSNSTTSNNISSVSNNAFSVVQQPMAVQQQQQQQQQQTAATVAASVAAVAAAATGMSPPNNSVATPPQTSSAGNSGAGVKYTKLWQGVLAGQRAGTAVPICTLEAYRQISSPDTLAGDWPQTMQIVRLIAQDFMNSKEYQVKSELLVFRPLSTHGFLLQLAEKKLCAVIQLPTQTLLLASADKPQRMIGMLFPGDMVVFKPQSSSTTPLTFNNSNNNNNNGNTPQTFQQQQQQQQLQQQQQQSVNRSQLMPNSQTTSFLP